MTDVYNQEVVGMPRERQLWQGGSRSDQMSKGEGSTSASGGFQFNISGTNVARTVTAITVVTPFVVLFSPVLLSVFVVVFLLATGYFTARELGVAAKTGLSRMYGYVADSNRNRTREDSFDRDTHKISFKDREMMDRDERPTQGFRGYETRGFRNRREGEGEGEESSHNLMKAATAATTGTSLVAFSGLTFVGTVIALVLATPPLLLFSPVLVPALITVFLLASGFVSSGGLGVAAATVFTWMYKLYSSEGRQLDTSHMFGSNPQESRSEGTRMFASYQESRSEGTRMFGSKPDQDKEDRLENEESRKPDSKMWETRDRDERAVRESRSPSRGVHEMAQNQNQGGNYQVVKAATTATVGGSLIVLSGLTFVGTVIALTMATPLLVLFSPVLVPALIAMSVLATGFVASGGFGVTGTMVLAWLYRYATNGQQRSDQDGSYNKTMNTMDLKGRERMYMSDQALRMNL